MPEAVDISQTDDPRDAIHQAVQVLTDGGLVGVPTETSYVAAALALNGPAVDQLRQLRETELVLGVKSANEAIDYVPRLSRTGRRLVSRFWPGPVTLAVATEGEEGLLQALPDETRRTILVNGALSMRVSDSRVLRWLLQLLPAPLVLQDDPHNSLYATAADATQGFGDAVSLVLDDGPVRFEQSTTRLHVGSDQWEVTRSGVVSETVLQRLASEVILFVCTGQYLPQPDGGRLVPSPPGE